MLIATQPVLGDLLTELQNNDNRFFDHGCRDLLPNLVEETTGELGDAKAAEKAIEQAIAHVWEDRAQIQSADALNTAVQTAVHTAVVRAKSRRAALERFERNEGVKQVRPRWPKVVLVLAVLAVCAGAYGLSKLEMKPDELSIQRSLSASDARPFSASDGQIGTIVLADESVVTLGAGSQLRVASDFGTSMRAVGLKGTASFAVVAAGPPFELRANGVALSLQSGTVDVRADSLAATLIRVRNGATTIKVGDSVWTASAGQAFVIETSKAIRAATPLDLDEGLSWLDRRFVATGSVREVVAKMNRWYAAGIGIGDASILDRPASARGSLDSLTATMKSLERSAKVQMVWNKDRMVLFGSAH